MTAAALAGPEKSTNGRSHTAPGAVALAMVRSTIGLTARLSPALAASWATRLFLTPRRFRRPERERALLARAEPLPRESDGIAAWRWGRGPTVLLVHGWAGRGAQLGALVDPLVEAGFAVVAFDGPAHGDSPGSTTTLVELADAILRLAGRIGPIHAVVAHSFGAAATMVAFDRGLDSRAAVFVAPPWNMEAGLRQFAAALGLSEELVEGVRRRIERRVGIRWETIEASAIAPRMQMPLLVAHDRHDGEVPWESGAALARAWPGASLLTTEGLGHRRILREPALLAAVVELARCYAPVARPESELERVLELEGLRI